MILKQSSITLKLLSSVIIALFIVFGCLALWQQSSSAVSGSQFKPGRIIDDSVFYNSSSMNEGQIQTFLNSKVPSCDTNGTGIATEWGSNLTRANYAASRGWQAPPYTCLRDFRQDTPQMEAASGLCGPISSGNRSAANIIQAVSQACNINPQVLIVLLEKEQSLITDVWPLDRQYRNATGFACPDTAPCDPQYNGFFYQVYHAARQFKVYQKNPNGYNYIAGRSNRVYWQTNLGNYINPSGNADDPSRTQAACGYNNVYIENQATAALYIYTPYQPNQKALSNLRGLGDACSAYGNRNFWRLFSDWFGSTTGPEHSWSVGSVNVYANSSHTQQVRTNGSELFLSPGQKVYVTVNALNQGRSTWSKGQTKLGTFSPIDYSSPFADSSWLAQYRIVNLAEDTVGPSQTGTFSFTITAPQSYGFYTEKYNLVTEGVTWFNDANLRLYITVQKDETNPQVPAQQILDQNNPVLRSGDTLSSIDRHSILKLQTDGNLDLFTNFSRTWSTKTSNASKDAKLVLQGDGNLVLYTSSNTPVWSSGTYNSQAAKLVLQSDGNLVLYTASNVPVWSSSTSIQDQTGLVNRTLPRGLTMYPGQSLTTPDRNYALNYQTDGNVVLVSLVSGNALWSTNTYRSSLGSLGLQMDGNLVLMNKTGDVIWASQTGTRGVSDLVLQQDGNLVLYNSVGQPTWSTNTFGRR